MSENQKRRRKKQFELPSAEKVQEELSKAESMDDFFGKEGIFSKLLANTLEQMLEAELSHFTVLPWPSASGWCDLLRKGLSPSSQRPCWAHKIKDPANLLGLLISKVVNLWTWC